MPTEESEDNTTVGGDEGEATERTVSYEKFKRVVQARDGLQSRVTELQEENQTLSEKAASVDSLMEDLRKSRADTETEKSRFQRYQKISSAIGSTDPDAIEAVEWQHSKLAGDDAPELGEWLKGLQEDPSKAPSILRPLFQGGGAAGAGTENASGKKRPKDHPGTGGGNPQGGNSSYSREQLREIRREAVRTGDWSRWKDARKGLVPE